MNSECIAIIANDPETSNDLHEFVPILGKRKTSHLGRAMIFDTWATCLSMSNIDVAVYYYPHSAKESFERMINLFAHEEKDWPIKDKAKMIKLYPQSGNQMIVTISNAFKDIFDMGYKRVIMMGAYCIPLSVSLLKAGFILLENKNVVIGPSFGGRYYLFGMSKCMPEVFEGVHWESNDFYIRLGENLNSAKAEVQELELSYEVYTPDELNQLIVDIERWRSIGDDKTAYHTERFLRTLE